MEETQFRQEPTTPDSGQQRAANAPEEYVLITGGPGSGKTDTLVETIGALLNRGVPPDKINIIGCTTHGERDLDRRLARHPGTRAFHPQITVVSFIEWALDILDTPGVDIPGALRGFTLWDRRQADQAFEDLVVANFDPAPAPRAIRRAIDWAHVNRERSAGDPLHADESWWLEALDLVSRQKRIDGVLAWDDLIPAAISAIASVPGVAERHRNQQDVHWVIDDFQEITPAQYDLLMLCRGPGGSITVSYNDDEAVGASKGASPALLDRFLLEPVSRGLGTYALSANHRSRLPLARAANRIAPRNPGGHPQQDGAAIPSRERPRLTAVEGRPVDQYRHMLTEARWRHEQLGRPWEDMAVLYDKPGTFDEMRSMVIAHGIPYTVLGGDGFRDGDADSVLAMLQLAVNPRDFGAFRRAASTNRQAPRLLDSEVAQAAYSTARTRRCDLVRAAGIRLAGYKYGSKAHRDLRHATEASSILQRMLEDRDTTIHGLCREAWRLLRAAQQVSPGEPADPQTRLLFTWAREIDPPSWALRENLARFLYDTNPDINRDRLSLERNNPLGGGRGMTFSTIDAAAGLEWGTVFLVDVRDDIFPGNLGRVDQEGMLLRARRRFYQASTRARDELRYYYPVISGETWHAEPTRFLEGLEDDLLERIWLGPRDPW